MSNECETLADIVAEMRRGTKLPGYWCSCDLNTILKYHADRIEAAWKRQMAQSWHHREMEELIAKHEKEVAELKKQTGNAAAMRRALSDMCYAAMDIFRYFRGSQNKIIANLGVAFDKAKAALAAPARNCDRFQVAAEALQEWQSLVKAKPNTWDFRYNYWLFAPAEERKGEGDGR